MTLRFTALLCGALAAAGASAASASAPDRLTWGWFNAAPYMIADGSDKGVGIFDQIRTLLKSEMPEYEHKDVQAPFPRILREISSGNQWCFVGGVKSPEREALYHFSAPVAVFLPFKVVVRRDRLAEFGGSANNPGAISLADLLNKPAMRTSFLRGRTFTPSINSLLQQTHLVETRQYHSEFNEALQMLLAKRLDYLIELPIISTYSARQLGRDGELAAIVIREHAEPTMNRVMCPRTEWGKQVVRKVDAVLHAERASARYRAIVERWSDDESVRAIRALYPTQFLKTE
jgi:polar amino acid transport system substrate-binding protein